MNQQAPPRERRKSQRITGRRAQEAVMDSIALTNELERDIASFVCVAAQGNTDQLEPLARRMISKAQRVEDLLQAALSGRFEGVEQEQKT